MVNSKFAGDFVIENFKTTELSAQKKKSGDSTADTIKVDQIPFSIGVGISHRTRGIPYFCTVSKPSSFFTEKRVHSVVD